MITKGTKIILKPFANYKDDPSKYQACEFGKDRYGEYLQFQCIDHNDALQGKRKSVGWLYLRVHTSLPLDVGEQITIDEVLYVMKKGNTAVVAVTIKEKAVGTIEEDEEDDSCGFEF